MQKCKDCGDMFGYFALKNGVCKGCINKKNKKTPPCNGCGKNFDVSELTGGYCKPCHVIEENRREQCREEKKQLKSIVLTTETNPNIEIEERLEIISAECVLGMNIFRDLFAGVRDIVGGRSKATQNVLRDARKEVLNELREEAFSIGANAVIGIDLDFSEFSGGGKSMLFVVATGTAVKLKI